MSQRPKNSSPIVKCSHCRQILSDSNFDSHNCDLPIIDVKRIPVVYFQDDSVNGEKIMTGRGIDGVLYTFVVTPRTPIPYMKRLSDGSYHDRKPDDKLPEPPSGCCKVFVGWFACKNSSDTLPTEFLTTC